MEEAAHQIKELAQQNSEEAVKNAAFKVELAIRRGNLHKVNETRIQLVALLEERLSPGEKSIKGV